MSGAPSLSQLHRDKGGNRKCRGIGKMFVILSKAKDPHLLFCLSFPQGICFY